MSKILGNFDVASGQDAVALVLGAFEDCRSRRRLPSA